VFSVGPLGCLPSQLASGNTNTNGSCIAGINDMCQGFNAAVRPMLNQLQAQLPGAKFSYGDAYNAVSEFMSNPAQYGAHIHSWHPPFP
jgi:phospholipase/lecithinase/hemolysin